MSVPSASGLQAVCLDHAVLCVDCEMVSNSVHTQCGVCGSRALLNVSVLLGGSLGAKARAVQIDFASTDITEILRNLIDSAKAA
jgi:hypothetical protein